MALRAVNRSVISVAPASGFGHGPRAGSRRCVSSPESSRSFNKLVTEVSHRGNWAPIGLRWSDQRLAACERSFALPCHDCVRR